MDEQILELIPPERLSSRQKLFRTVEDQIPLYQLRSSSNELTTFQDFMGRVNPVKSFAIWRDNDTLLFYRVMFGVRSQCKQRHISFLLRIPHDSGFDEYYEFNLFGTTDSAIAETATWFCSLQHPPRNVVLRVHNNHNENRSSLFDFCTLQAKQLAQILDANPSTHFAFHTDISEEQSVILATRPYPLTLELIGNCFADDGAVFVDTLAKRQSSSFGVLTIDAGSNQRFPLSCFHLKRLNELDYVFKRLVCYTADEETALIPLSAKVPSLSYLVRAKNLQPTDFEGVTILPKDLSFGLRLDDEDNDSWAAIMISFLDRVAEVGYFEGLNVFVQHKHEDYDNDPEFSFEQVAPVADALIRAIQANPKLSYLDLSYSYFRLNWARHLDKIFKAIEEHPGLRTLVVQGDEIMQDDDEEDEEASFNLLEASFTFEYSWLERLLSRNRNITVLNGSNEKCCNKTINKLYAFNAFYNGLEKLKTDSPASRQLLVAAALTECACANLQYTALLLSNHTDVLCELLNA